MQRPFGSLSQNPTSAITFGFQAATWLILATLILDRSSFLSADFPNGSPWMSDQAKYTDEGWWASGAVSQQLLGHWSVAGDYNPTAALPVWPLLLAAMFRVTGVNLIAARALSVAFSIASLGLVYLLVLAYARVRHKGAATVALLLLASSPIAFAFSRLALLETPVSFEFCLILLAVSRASARRIGLLFALPGVIAAMILTKTTAAVLLPAVAWLLWHSLNRRSANKMSTFLLSFLLAVVAPALLVFTYSGLVARSPYGIDYQYFFNVNAMGEIAWEQTPTMCLNLVRHALSADPVLCILGFCSLAIAIAWKRSLWRNPLFISAWIALACQAAFIFSRQEDDAPRYFLWMLIPLAAVSALTLAELIDSGKGSRLIAVLAMSCAVVLNVSVLTEFAQRRTYDYNAAAESIRTLIQSHPSQPHLILGVSGSQLSLMTGIPSISDAYGTEEMAEKLRRYQPGWYVAWNQAIDSTTVSLYDLQPIATYSVFDDPDRNRLTLYRMTSKHNIRETAKAPSLR